MVVVPKPSCIQVAGVQTILDSVTQALADNPDRKFVYGEMVSFWPLLVMRHTYSSLHRCQSFNRISC